VRLLHLQVLYRKFLQRAQKRTERSVDLQLPLTRLAFNELTPGGQPTGEILDIVFENDADSARCHASHFVYSGEQDDFALTE